MFGHFNSYNVSMKYQEVKRGKSSSLYLQFNQRQFKNILLISHGLLSFFFFLTPLNLKIIINN